MVESSEKTLESVKEEEVFNYSCKACRLTLFTSNELEEHSSNVKKLNARKNI